MDEILVHLAPVLLGNGVRLFARDGAAAPVELETLSVTRVGQMTTLRFRSCASTSDFWEGNPSSGHQPGSWFVTWTRPSIDTVSSRALDCLRHACSRASPPPAGAACPPVAIVEGAAEIVTPVAAVLRRRGLRSGPSGCGRVVRASLVARPGLNAYGLHIEDGYGRVSDREIADASTAASLIESWAIDEDADVLAPRTAPAAIARAPAAPPVPVAGAPAAFRVTTRGEIATATDGSVWYGGALAACGRVGLMCLGGRARIARDGGGDGGGGLTGTLTRTRIDAGAAAALPLSRGAFTLAPAIGVGAVLDALDHQRASRESGRDPRDVVDDFALGVDAGIGAAYAVGAHWSVVTELGALFANPVSSRRDDSRWDFVPLPPRGFFHVGLGLQYAR